MAGPYRANAASSAQAKSSGMARAAVRIVATHHALGTWTLAVEAGAEPLFCENESNTRRLWDDASGTAYPKDGINDHVVSGAATVNPALTGTRAAFRRSVTVAAGATVQLRLRLHAGDAACDLGDDHARTLAARRVDADAFHAVLVPEGTTADEAAVLRQALAGMIWSYQFYNYSVERWLDGDPGCPRRHRAARGATAAGATSAATT